MEFMQRAMAEMPHGREREYVAKRIDELNKRMEREVLEAQGLPIPPHLMPEEPHDHSDHFHGPGGHHHGPGEAPGMPVMPGLPQIDDDHDHQNHYHD